MVEYDIDNIKFRLLISCHDLFIISSILQHCFLIWLALQITMILVIVCLLHVVSHTFSLLLIYDFPVLTVVCPQFRLGHEFNSKGHEW